MIRILYKNERGALVTDLPLYELAEVLASQAGPLWLDFDAESAALVEPVLNDVFMFHPLAVDDALRESHVPKVDDWQGYLYVVLRAVAYSSVARSEDREDRLQVPELDVFLGSNYVVTYHSEAVSALEQVWAICQSDDRWLGRGAGHLLYRLVDQLVSDAVTSAEQMDEDLDQFEDQIFAAVGPATLAGLFALKHEILQLRRIVIPLRDVFNKMSRNNYAVIDDTERLYFRDVYDHLMQLDHLLDDMLILVGSALDTYLSVVNNRMNDIMKTLTVITAFFMPLAFITGFFGMNFFEAAVPLNTWTDRLVFAAVLVAMMLIPVIMYFWMRRRSWI
jgi:magnesium transporter